MLTINEEHKESLTFVTMKFIYNSSEEEIEKEYRKYYKNRWLTPSNIDLKVDK